MYWLNNEQSTTLNLGSLTALEATYISIINSTANCWKHESEWEWDR